MSTSILICLVSAIFWALFDLTRKLSLEIVNAKILLLLFSIIQTIIFSIWCIKESFSFNFVFYLIPGFTLVLLGIFSAFIFLKSIKESELSLTIPLLSFSPLFSSIFAFILLGETLNIKQYLGVFTIIFGTLILYSEKLELYFFIKSFLNIKNNLSAKLMILVSFCWSLTPVLDKICLKHSSMNIHGLVQAISTFIILFFFSLREIKQIKTKKFKNFKLIIVTVSIGTLATVLQFYAIILNFVPIMESIKRAVGQFCAVGFGNLFFKERFSSQKIIGVSVLSLGVYLIV